MNPWLYALWGAFGGLAVEAIQFYGAIRRTGKWPWKTKGEPRPGPLAASVVIRVGVGFGLAFAAFETNQVSGPLGAIAVGVAAPLLIEQMAKRVPLDAQSPDPGAKDAR
jgi:hypothetical protein